MRQIKSLGSVLLGLCVLYVSLLSNLIAQETQRMEVEGTVVDEQGRPIEGAIIYPLTYMRGRSGSADDVEPRTEAIFGTSSLKNGFFGIELNWRPGTIARIWIEAPRPSNCWSPIDVSSASLKLHQVPGLEGILIEDYASRVQLGMVNAVVQYYVVKIDLPDAPEEFTRDAMARKVMMEIKDVFGSVVSTTSINLALRMRPLRLEFCLPEGTWQVDFLNSREYDLEDFPKRITVPKTKPDRQANPASRATTECNRMQNRTPRNSIIFP